jgi:hypothetical protein
MDKLEQYLNRICRSIGGPRPLREHVRQELREHLVDAMARHRAEGLSEEEALGRALEEFGNPDDVRSGLEATHGHRMLAVVIDKALHWKEMTMRARWLWMSWAYLALAAVIALEVLFISFNVVFIVPKFQKLMHDGMIDPAIIEESGVRWTPAFLGGLSNVVGHYTLPVILLAAAMVGLFEWRVRSENKSLMRLSALGTATLGLMMVIIVMSGSLVVSFCLGMPALGRMVRPWVVEQVETVGTSIGGIEQAQAKKDWGTMQEQAAQASTAMKRLSEGPALHSLSGWNGSPTSEELRANLSAVSASLSEARQAIREKDEGRLKTSLEGLRKSYEPVREAARRLER